MPICAVYYCPNKSKTSNFKRDGISFHLFPKNNSLKEKWKQACNRHPSWKPTRTSTICSKHFGTGMYLENNIRRKLIDQAIPTLSLTDSETATNKIATSDSVTQANSLQNKLKSNQKKLDDEDIPSLHVLTDSETSINIVASNDSVIKTHPNIQNEKTVMINIVDIPKKRRLNSGKAESLETPTLEFTLRKKKLINKISFQAKKIKRLQSKTRYYKKKVTSLEELLKGLYSKLLIDMEQK